MSGGQAIVLRPAAQESLDGITCGDGEERCFIFTEFAQIGLFLPASVKKRHPENNLLLGWEYTALLPPDLYSIVYVKKGVPGVCCAIPDAKLSLEDYPKASKSPRDPETAAGFASRKDLRLVLRPQAFRFFWYGLHEPLLVPGAWPTARQVMMDGYQLQPEARDALAGKLAAIPVDLSTAWLTALRASLQRRYWPSAAGAMPLPTADAPPPAANAPPSAADAPSHAAVPSVAEGSEMMRQLAGLSGRERAQVIEHLLESMPVAADLISYDDPVSDILTVAGVFRVRAERDTPPDIMFAPDGGDRHFMRLLDGSMWAYDLDSIVRLSDDEAGAPRFGYSRILQVIARGGPGVQALASQPAGVSVPSPRPAWAEPLARWYSSLPCDDVRLYHQAEPIVGRWHALNTRQFWAHHECRVWQFVEPRVMEYKPHYLEELHELLYGGGDSCASVLRCNRYTTFSSSLLASGWQALGFGNDMSQNPPGDLMESGTWDLGGFGSEAATPSAVRALLPFYEAMRQRQKAHENIFAPGSQFGPPIELQL